MGFQPQSAPHPPGPNPYTTPWPKLIDIIASSNPSKPYASIPNSADIDELEEKGYRDFSYGELSGAVDRMAWWLDENLGGGEVNGLSSGNQAVEDDEKGDGVSERNGDIEDDEKGVTMKGVVGGEERRMVNGVGDEQKKQKKRREKFECFAFLGGEDLRYPFLLMAAIKTKRQVLLPSFTNSPTAHLNLLKETNCKTLIGTTENIHIWESLKDEIGGDEVEILTLPSFAFFAGLPEEGEGDEKGKREKREGERGEVERGEVKRYVYDERWEDCKDDPVLILHTSGTTGLPKPIRFTMHMVSIFHGPPRHTAHNKGFHNARLIVPLPMSWSLCVFLFTSVVFTTNMIPIMLPASTPFPPPAKLLHRVHMTASPPPEGGVYTPSMVKELVAMPEALAAMKRLFSVIFFGGAPLDLATGNALAPHMRVLAAMGSTECGSYGLDLPPDHLQVSSWMYYNFSPDFGWRFEHFDGELYESVLIKMEGERGENQMIFHSFPELRRYETRDLWERHDEVPTMWRFRGRKDDFCKLKTLTKWNAADVEGRIVKEDKEGLVGACVMGGDGRESTCLVLELKLGIEGGKDTEEQVWRIVERVNEGLTEEIKIGRDKILFLNAGTLKRVGVKGTVSRIQLVKDFAAQIEELYKDENGVDLTESSKEKVL